MTPSIPSTILTTEASKDYELIDSGDGEKLERFGDYILARPDPQALWKKLAPEKWADAHGTFIRTGKETRWEIKPDVPERWQITLGDLTFFIRPTSFKHTGIFPEQLGNWQWLEKVVTEKTKILNLFGYTGGATLACAKAGAEVVHVDGSKVAMTWAGENAEASGLKDKPIRWILDDARAFVKREIKRGARYDGIIMDPPSFGHGPKKEAWKIEDDLVPLLDDCKQLLSDNPTLFLINGYASGYSALAYQNALTSIVPNTGKIETGELTIKESHGGRLLPAGIFARWSK